MKKTERQHSVAAIQQSVLVGLLLLGIWLLAHPYDGIWHDAWLYALQALAHLHPDAYRNDLFFFSGSQDDFSFFSPLYSTLISLLGLNAASMTLLLGAYALWTASAAWLLRSLLQGFSFWLGLALIFAMPSSYGGAGVFSYAESFLTPRLIAEGLTLLSLAMLIKGKSLAFLAAMAAAFAMHPLMALAGAGFAAFYAAQERPKAAFGTAALGLALLIGFVAFNVAPFSRLLDTMDKQWFDLVFARSPFVLWDGWKQEDWLNRVLLAFSLLVSAGAAAQGAHRRAFLAALAVGYAALLVTWVGTSLFHNVLLIQIQPWRALWLAQLFSWIAAAFLAAQFWHRGPVFRIFLLGFLSASLTIGTVGGVLALLVAALSIWQDQRGKEIHLSQTSTKLLYVFPLLVVALWLANSGLVASIEFPWTASPLENFVKFTLNWIKALLEGSRSGIIAVALFAAIWRYGPDQRIAVHLSALAGVLFVLFLSIAIWHRPNQQDPIPTFTRHIPVGAVVYWENDPRMTWFALGRSNYTSKVQTAGILFSRQTAIEGKRRMDRLAALGLADSDFKWQGDASQLPKASLNGLVHVCHDPILDYVILSTDLGVGVIEKHADEISKKYFYLYGCAELRRNFRDTWPDQFDK